MKSTHVQHKQQQLIGSVCGSVCGAVCGSVCGAVCGTVLWCSPYWLVVWPICLNFMLYTHISIAIRQSEIMYQCTYILLCLKLNRG